MREATRANPVASAALEVDLESGHSSETGGLAPLVMPFGGPLDQEHKGTNVRTPPRTGSIGLSI